MVSIALALSACAPPGKEMKLRDGPPIEDVVTTIDDALACMDGRIAKNITFAVGAIPDATGKEQFNEGGTGKFVTQAAGDVVQSALFKTGVSIVNRRDPSIAVNEGQWGLRDIRSLAPANFFVTGSINTLDFLPGGGAYATVGGVGPRYRQNRILVGMDLFMTNAATGQVVAAISLNKQIYADELGLMAARVEGTTVIDFDLGVQRREAINFAMRQMLQLATFELLSQMMPAESYVECRGMIDEAFGRIEGKKTSGEQIEMLEEAKAGAAEAAGTDEGGTSSEATPEATPEARAEAGGATEETAPTDTAEAVATEEIAPIATADAAPAPDAAEVAAETAAAEEAEAARAEAEKVAADKAAAAKAKADKAKADKAAAEKAKAEKAAAAKAKAEKAKADKAAADKAAAEKAATEKAAAEKAKAEKAAAAKAKADKAKAEKAAAAKAKAEKAAAAKAAAEKAKAEKAAAAKAKADKAKADKAAAAKAKAEKAAAAKAAAAAGENPDCLPEFRKGEGKTCS